MLVENRGKQDHKAHKESKDFPVRRVLKVPRAHKGFKGSKVQLVRQDHKAHRVQMA